MNEEKNGMAETVKTPATLSRVQKYLTTFAIFYSTFTFGVSFNVLSPSIIDFKNKFNVQLEEITIAFTILTASYLSGALICGILYKFGNRQAIVICILFSMASSLLIMPHASSLLLFFVLSAILGFGAGGYDTAQTAWVIEIWKGEAAPFIFGQRFTYSLGTALPPLLLAPFLTDEVTHLSNSTGNPLVENSEFKLTLPFTIVGGLLALGVLVHIIIFLKLKCCTETHKVDLKNVENVEKGGEVKKTTKLQTVGLLALACCALGPYVGMEFTTMQFLPTFAVYSDMSLTKAEGAQILFGLTVAFCIGRAIGTVIVLKVPSHIILCGNFILMLSGNVVLLIFAPHSKLMLWIAGIALGAGMSTVYGSGVAFVQQFLTITDTIAAMITTCGGVVAAVFPLIIGKAIEFNPTILCHVNFFSIALAGGSFVMFWWVTKSINKKQVE